jgi:integrase
VLTPDPVAQLIEAAPGPGLKYKVALSVAYGAGLRGCEVVMLRVSDIDSQRMLIRVEMGKGRKDRHAMLSPQLRVKDYRIEGLGRYTTMTLDVDEFIRRFLIHVLPKDFHRIRHYGLFAGSNRAETIETVREFLNLDPPAAEETVAKENGEADPEQPLARPCPCCGGRMFVIETFEPGRQPRHRPTAPLVVSRIDTS